MSEPFNVNVIDIELLDTIKALGVSAPRPWENHKYYLDIGTSFQEKLNPNYIYKLRSALNCNGCCVIQTDVQDYAPQTPEHYLELFEGPYYGEIAMAIVCSTLGAIQSISHQNEGRLFHDIYPLKTQEMVQTSGSSRVMLDLHTELAFEDNPPDYLALFCVRPDHDRQAKTLLFDSFAAARDMTLERFRLLCRNEFSFGIDFNISGQTSCSDAKKSIFANTGMWLDRYDIDLFQRGDDTSNDAFDDFTVKLKSHCRSVLLQSGQIILIDNKRLVHSRSPFSARYDGSDRWLKRALIRKEHSRMPHE